MEDDLRWRRRSGLMQKAPAVSGLRLRVEEYGEPVANHKMEPCLLGGSQGLAA